MHDLKLANLDFPEIVSVGECRNNFTRELSDILLSLRIYKFGDGKMEYE